DDGLRAGAQGLDHAGLKVRAAREAVEIDALGTGPEQSREHLFRWLAIERLQHGCAHRVAAPRRRGEGVDHASTAERALGRHVAQDEAIAGQCGQWTVGQQLDEGLLSGRHRGVAPDHDARGDVGRGEVQVHRGPVPQRLGLRGEHPQPHV
ncbi:MAG: hypothetical protein ACK559_36315, partial [bacterium]